jgi:Zn-dependent protease
VHIDRVTVLFFVALIVSVILHEISHGVVAWWFGDDTAKRAGRLTLNPVPHIDPFGSIILPALLAVSLAGPACNFALMAVGAVVARALPHHVTGDVVALEDLPLAVQIAFIFAIANLFLGLFNLIPIPPLDGSAIVERMLPKSWLPAWYRFRPYGMLVLFLLVFSFGIGRIFVPFERRLAAFVLR